MDPRTRLGLLGSVGLFSITLERVEGLAVLTVFCALALVVQPIGRAWRMRTLWLLLAAIWGCALSQGMFFADHPRVAVVSVGPLVIYREGLLHGLVQSMRLASVSLAGIALATSTSTDRMLAGLVALRVPFGLAFLAVAALRFLPDTVQELLVVRKARARRGRPAGNRGPWARLVLEISMLRPVVSRALRRSRTLAESLDTRGFDPVAKRTSWRPLRMRGWEVVLVVVALGAASAAALARLVYALYVSEIAWHPALRPLYGFVRSWL